MFKNIPKQDLDMLLPGTRVKMSLFDQGKILLPTLSGIALTVMKLVKAGIMLAFAGFYGLLAFLGLVGGTVGYGVKSFLGYLRTLDKYRLHLTRSLYYQNLDNNSGVLFRVLDEAESQDFCEAVLAYFFLWREAGPRGWTTDELDRRIEEWLRSVLDADIDFEVEDGTGKLQKFGLVEEVDPNRWRARSIVEAVTELDNRWDQWYEAGQPG
jgi:hypothetical protein